MITVTGAAGFIGSAIISELNRRGISDIIAVDEREEILDREKLKNLDSLSYETFRDRNEFIKDIENGGDLGFCVIHMGACSSTTETDRSYIMEKNYEYTRRLCIECIKRGVRFIYASSAATYGDGQLGFSDNHDYLEKYKPLNLYGKSKHEFDLWAKKEGLLKNIAGLKYFNVYGPNEYHKGSMRSFVLKAYEQIKSEDKVKLFKSYHPGFADGEQKRDFIYIKDAVEMTLCFMDNPGVNGIYNIGTAVPGTWNSLASAVFRSMGVESDIEYVEMPPKIKEKYQYYTRADMEKYLKTGLSFNVHSLEEGVDDYIKNYLFQSRRLGKKPSGI